MKNKHLLLLSLFSGLLLWLAWPPSVLNFLIFVGWVPLLYVAENSRTKVRFFLYTYLCMLLWNAATTWWIWNASPPGAAGAILLNSLFMCLPWLGYYSVRKKLGDNIGQLALITYWMTFEFLHLQDWGLSWPWLTLGNIFAIRPEWVQWYEFTGAAGGTLWVLLVNIFIFRLFSRSAIKNSRPAAVKWSTISAVSLALPLAVSLLITPDTQPDSGSKNVVVVQPNVDPYTEKFSEGTLVQQIQHLITLSDSKIDSNTALVVWPETAVAAGIWEESINHDPYYAAIWEFLNRHPHINLFTGINSYKMLNPEAAKGFSARALPGSGGYYEAFNSGALLNHEGGSQIYHKSMLVPGVEMLPSWLGFMAPLFDDFGGISGTLGKQEERTVLHTSNNSYKIAPSICYESIYGEFMSRYTRNGANLIAIITNDGWWGDTEGYRQHLQYARLRAVENRKWVVRSANTGISCFISPAGEVIEPQPWDTIAVIKMNIPALEGKTLYVQTGDLLFKFSGIMAVILLCFSLFKRKDQISSK